MISWQYDQNKKRITFHNLSVSEAEIAFAAIDEDEMEKFSQFLNEK